MRSWLATCVILGITDRDLAISAMSLIILERLFAEGPLTPQRLALQDRCRTLAQEFRDRKAILPVTDQAVTAWLQVRALDLTYLHKDGRKEQAGFEEQLLLATALSRRMTLVDRRQPAHLLLAPLGLLIEDPFSP
jgi:hypothetical protein